MNVTSSNVNETQEGSSLIQRRVQHSLHTTESCELKKEQRRANRALELHRIQRNETPSPDVESLPKSIARAAHRKLYNDVHVHKRTCIR